jgi:hypothetical protein
MISKPGMQSGMQRIGFGESKGQSSIHINTWWMTQRGHLDTKLAKAETRPRNGAVGD